MDMNYVWQFMPGSEIGVAWKVSSSSADSNTDGNYLQNLSYTFHQPQTNNFSLKVLYYIDYQDLRRKRKIGANLAGAR
jgi:hypothetical protein